MKIITASNEHISGIVDLWIELMNYHTELNPFHVMREGAPDNWEKYLRKSIASETGQVFVALDGEIPVGYVIGHKKDYPPLFRLDHYGFISDMCVTENYRRKGIGQELLNHMLDWFKSQGLERFELRVEPTNDAGIAFWEKQGFREHVRTLYLD